MFMKEKSSGLLDRMKARRDAQKGVNAEDIVQLCEIVNGGLRIAVDNHNKIEEIKENQDKIYSILKKLSDRSNHQTKFNADVMSICEKNHTELQEHKMSTNESFDTITQALSSTDEALADLCSDMNGVYEDFNKLGLVSNDEIWVRKSDSVQEEEEEEAQNRFFSDVLEVDITYIWDGQRIYAQAE
jgi:hypothetical protein